MSDRSAHVFVSYSRGDSEVVKAIVGELVTRDVPVWWDAAIPAGSEADVAMSKAIDDAAAVLVFLSESWDPRSPAALEVTRVLQQGKPIVPVLLDDAAPSRTFGNLQCIQFRGNVGRVADMLAGFLKQMGVEPTQPPPSDLVFISAKSADYEYAQQLYDFLVENEIPTFFSRESLPELGNADYRREIDKALDEAVHMVVVASAVEHAQSPWVEAEWGFFINEKRSGRKAGNLVTVAVGSLLPQDLPPSLRYYEVIPYDDAAFGKILRYVGRPAE